MRCRSEIFISDLLATAAPILSGKCIMISAAVNFSPAKYRLRASSFSTKYITRSDCVRDPATPRQLGKWRLETGGFQRRAQCPIHHNSRHRGAFSVVHELKVTGEIGRVFRWPERRILRIFCDQILETCPGLDDDEIAIPLRSGPCAIREFLPTSTKTRGCRPEYNPARRRCRQSLRAAMRCAQSAFLRCDGSLST
jgi:hypothetical protein